jgi:hypothetical protein
LAACAGHRLPNAPTAPETFLGMREDVGRLVRPSNAERLDGVLELLKRQGITYELQPFANTKRDRDSRERGTNVIVSVGQRASDIVVGAHFDAARVSPEKLSDGAVDNGSGVVVLSRLVRAFQGISLRHRVRLVFFDMEEIGLLGSTHFVKAQDAGRVAAMVNVDIAGYGDTLIFGPSRAPGNWPMYAAIWTVCALNGRTCVEYPQFPSGDERSFQALNVPNISVAVLPRVEAHQLWLTFNGGAGSGLREGFFPGVLRTIHSTNDTVDKVEAPAMSLVVDSVRELVRVLDTRLP